MSKKEFRALENSECKKAFNEIIIVPTGKKHDSGFECMKFVLCHNREIVGVTGGCSDVIHLNGIGGYGKSFEEALKTRKTDVVDWKIDCLPKSHCLRLFSSKNLKIKGFVISDFDIIAE